MKSFLILPDGVVISSGGDGRAIKSTEFTRSVNSGTELMPGAVCAGMLRVTVFAPEGLGVQAGQELTFYQTDSLGNRLERGAFVAEKPESVGRYLYRLTAFDRVCRLDKDLTGWLEDLTGWPYDLYTFAGMVCEACGVTLTNVSIPNGSLPVAKFSARGITGRQLMQWIGQISGQFCRARPDGELELAWYEPAETAVRDRVRTLLASGADGQVILAMPDLTGTLEEGNLTLSPLAGSWEGDTLTLRSPDQGVTFFYQGSFSPQAYTVAPVERVRVALTQQDVGAVYPDEPGAKNTCSVTGNPLLSAASAGELEQVARSLYELLSPVSYTPCSVTVPAEADIAAGRILEITDSRGISRQMYVMSAFQQGQRLTLTATGSPSRGSSFAVNNQSWENLSGKVLELRADVDGLTLENRDAKGQLAALGLSVDGISAKVAQQEDSQEKLESQLTQVRQTAGELSVQVQTIQTEGVSRVVTGMGYSFTDEGLLIQSAGQQMENRLDHRGMRVERAGEVLLQADKDGVLATDVTVRNYLLVGSHARFEDYSDGNDGKRTACFFV